MAYNYMSDNYDLISNLSLNCLKENSSETICIKLHYNITNKYMYQFKKKQQQTLLTHDWFYLARMQQF